VNTLVLDRPTFQAVLTESPAGVTLRWTDFVANEWHEKFESLAEGLMRLAALDVGVKANAAFSSDQSRSPPLPGCSWTAN
jgi:hypothetical protein